MKIAYKLVLGTLLLALMIWVVGFYAVNTSKKALRNSIEGNSLMLSQEVIQTIDRTITSQINYWRFFLSAPTIQNQLAQSNARFSAMPNPQRYIDDSDRQWRDSDSNNPNKLMEEITSRPISAELISKIQAINKQYGYDLFSEVFITNAYGTNVAQTQRTSDYRQDDEDWWQRARDNGIYVSDITFDDSSRTNSIDIALRVDDKNGHFLGVLKAVMDAKEVIDIAQNVSDSDYLTKRGGIRKNVLLIDSNGQVIYASQLGDKIQTDKKTYSHLSEIDRNDNGTFLSKDNTLGEVLIAYAKGEGSEDINGLGWTMVLEFPTSDIFASTTEMQNSILVTAIVVTILGLILGIGFSINISRRLRLVRDVAVATGNGDFTQRLGIKHRDEIGQLSRSFDKMAETLEINDKRMRSDDWIKSGRTKLNDEIRGDQEPEAIASKVITFVCEYLDAKVGAIYLAGEDAHLHMVSSYAYKRRKNVSNSYSIGEGLVGQAAMENKIICLTNVPDDYMAINSGLGETSPENIVVLPFSHEGEIKGVLEIGTLTSIDDNTEEFLNQISDSVGITIHSAQARQKVQKLLEQTQAQAEELEVQQEELRQTNEELEEQTRALKISEEKLRTQQEELEDSNQSLEERTEALEKERDQVNKANWRLEEARRDLEAKAQDLETTSRYKSQFLANMSHELRTPLNSLLILSKLLMDNKDGNLTEKQVNFASTINSSGAELLNLINDVLDLAKVESGKMELSLEDIEIEPFISELRDQFSHMAQQHDLELNLEIEDGAPQSITTDSQRLGQILKNLLSNALKFTQQGSIALTVSKPFGDIVPTRPGLSLNSAVQINVTDTGIGIPEDKQSIIFEAFKQADGSTCRKYGGTGLGLSICRGLVDLLGGEIHMRSAAGKGSTFILLLPIDLRKTSAPADRPERKPHQEKIAIPATSNMPQITEKVPAISNQLPSITEINDDRDNLNTGDKSILIVEDDENFAKTLREVVREKGYKSLIAVTGEMALSMTSEYLPTAVLMDIGLPKLDGLAVMARLKEDLQTRHIPVHVISGHQQHMDALRMGATGFLSKPVNTNQLDNALEKINSFASSRIRKVLVVEDEDAARRSITELLASRDIEITAVESGSETLARLRNENFDCIVLDLKLPDMPGEYLLEQIRSDESLPRVPVVVFTGKELTSEETSALDKYAERIIIKGAKSPERLVDEVSLFLHLVEKDLPQDQRKMIRVLHNSEAIFNGKTVMMVDDDVRNIFALSSVLEDRGMNIEVARNGRECLEKLEEVGNQVDLILMDIMMPEMDGYEAMKRIRRQPHFAKLPIIALTAKAMKGDRSKCIEAGASDYLAKPVDQDRLLSMLRVWLYGTPAKSASENMIYADSL